MRFKLDENLPAQAASFLRSEGFDAHSVFEEGLTGSADVDIAKVCRDESRILLTPDLDFADLRAYPPRGTPGIIVLRLARPDRDSVLAILPRLLLLLRAEPIRDHLWVVDEARTRIRSNDS